MGASLRNTKRLTSGPSKTHTLRVLSTFARPPKTAETSDLLCDGGFGRQSFDRACAVETIDAIDVIDDVSRVLRFGDGAAMAKNNHVVAHRLARVHDAFDALDARVDRLRALGAYAATTGRAHVRDHDVRARPRHHLRLLLVEDIRGREEIHLAR